MSQIDYKARQDLLRDYMMPKQITAVALVPGENLLYFTGLDLPLSATPVVALVLAAGGVAIVIGQTDVEKLADLPFEVKAVFTWADDEGYAGAVAAAAEAFGFNTHTLGVDEMTMRVFEFLAVQNAAPDIQIWSMGQTLIDIRAG